MDYQRHGLTGSMKRRVFDALMEIQQGRCAICGVSQEEIIEKHQSRLETLRQEAEKFPADHWLHQWYLRKFEQGPAPIHCTLFIDHCHESGCIRGLLCNRCNGHLGMAEYDGLFHYYSTPAYQYKRLNPYLAKRLAWERGRDDNWLDLHRNIILLYMQRDRWLPRKDILFHLQSRT